MVIMIIIFLCLIVLYLTIHNRKDDSRSSE